MFFTYVQPGNTKANTPQSSFGDWSKWGDSPLLSKPRNFSDPSSQGLPGCPFRAYRVNSGSIELLDPWMMSKAHVVGGFLGDFICWISTGDELWTILGESCRHGTGKLTKLRSFDSFENDRYTLKYMYDPSFTENHCSFSKDNQDVAKRRMDKVVSFCNLHRAFFIISYNIGGFIN